MKNSKLGKIVLIIIMSLTVIIATKNVFAAQSLTDGTLTGTSNTSNSLYDSLLNSTPNNAVKNNVVNNNVVNNNVVNNNVVNNNVVSNKITNSPVLTTSNTSKYNNTSLPKTGVEDSMPIVILSVVLGISAIYAYKKMQDYKNI